MKKETYFYKCNTKLQNKLQEKAYYNIKDFYEGQISRLNFTSKLIVPLL